MPQRSNPFDQGIPDSFLSYAAGILGETNKGLSGSNIVKEFAKYAATAGADIPHFTYPNEAQNKRTAVYENLKAFAPDMQYQIIMELSRHPSLGFSKDDEREELRSRLITRFKQFGPILEAGKLNVELVEETIHWMSKYKKALRLFEDAISKYKLGLFRRNTLDDLRCSMEQLLREIFQNDRPLEKQLSEIGLLIKNGGGSKELSNMIVQLIDYYSKYQNTYVKHDDLINSEEVEIVFELTSAFMKHLSRIASKLLV